MHKDPGCHGLTLKHAHDHFFHPFPASFLYAFFTPPYATGPT
ncbi:hypothetical protein BN2537_15027 [Streptomyces venezuelae]|nr:hypothetical protein BN2537_15027 [Streptomyces venezuelae]